MQTSVVVLGGARTPMGEFNGSLSHLTEVELGATAARGALERTGVDAALVDHVVFGQALQSGRDAVYGARHVGLRAGLRIEVPALTVNRLCGSGIQAIVSGAQMIGLGEAAVVLAGGMESMSQAPHLARGLRSGMRLGDATLEDSLTAALLDGHCGLMMAQTAEVVGGLHGVTREAADAFALLSQQRTQAARKAGHFKDEIVPTAGRRKGASVIVEEDEHPRPATTLASLASLRTVFSTSLVTAGNASGIVDGAAAVVLASEDAARRMGRPVLGRIVTWFYAGVEPRHMGMGPVPAIRGALRKAGLSLGQIDLLEINEAFAAQYLAVAKELDLPAERVNVNGGAIAMGHPLGATGARLTLALLLEMRRRSVRLGIASACIGGGQGIAIIVESVT